MDNRDNYWFRRLADRGVTRRRFIGGAATTGVGAAALGLVGCGDDDDDGGGSGGGTTPGTSASPTAAVAQPVKGGIARFTSANNTWDTFDIERSIFSTTAAYVVALANLGIVHYDNFADAKLGGGFAQKWEQPDPLTMNFTLRDGLFWQNKPPVNGRAATSKDMAEFVLRERDNKLRDGTVDRSTFYRGAQYALVDSVTTPDDKTMQVKFKSPNIFFLDSLASSYAKVQAPEAIDKFEKEYNKLQAEQIIGTGPFELVDFKAEGTLNHKRFDKFPSPALLDGIRFLPLFDQAAGQAAFEQKQIDAFAPTQNAVLDDLLNRLKGKITEIKGFAANPQAGTYYGGAAPWNNPNIIGAIFRTIDRRTLISSLLQGKAALSGNVPPTQAAFGITEKELITFPGYLEDRAKEESEAKKMWDAGGGAALGEIIVDIPDIWEGLYSGGAALITNQLKKVLGNTFTAKIEPYSTITNKVTTAAYGNGKNNIWWGWISEITDPEPTLGNFLTYNSAQPQFKQFGVKIDKVDQLSASAVSEFDLAKRQDANKEMERELIKAYGAGIHYSLVGVGSTLVWNYYHPTEIAPFVTSQQFATRQYFDQNDPTWAGRPA